MSGVAVITGGQRGIGFGIAAALVEAGRSVALTSEHPETSPEVPAALERLGPKARYFQHDMRDVEAIPALLDQVERALGPVSALISNAGIGAPVRGDLLDVAPESFDLVMDINLRGAFFLAQAVAQRMLAQPSQMPRTMVFITSVSAAMASVERGEYCLSKAAASMMAQLFALRLAPHGIAVFELRPGIIATDMTEAVYERYDARIKAGLVPAARWGQPADIGTLVVPLVEGRASFATGAVIPVDGGLSIARL